LTYDEVDIICSVVSTDPDMGFIMAAPFGAALCTPDERRVNAQRRGRGRGVICCSKLLAGRLWDVKTLWQRCVGTPMPKIFLLRAHWRRDALGCAGISSQCDERRWRCRGAPIFEGAAGNNNQENSGSLRARVGRAWRRDRKQRCRMDKSNPRSSRRPKQYGRHSRQHPADARGVVRRSYGRSASSQ
jgi:hypothetical protein